MAYFGIFRHPVTTINNLDKLTNELKVDCDTLSLRRISNNIVFFYFILNRLSMNLIVADQQLEQNKLNKL